MKIRILSVVSVLLLLPCVWAASVTVERGETRKQRDGRLEVTGGDPSFALGTQQGKGTFLLEGGEVDVASGNVRIGSQGTGILHQTGGRFVVRNGFIVVARHPKSSGTYRLEGGVLRGERLCMVVGEEADGSLVVEKNGVLSLLPETQGPGTPEGGLWIGYRTTGNGHVRLATGGTLRAKYVRTGAGRSRFVFDGGLFKCFPKHETKFLAAGPGAAQFLVGSGGVRLDTAGGDCRIPFDLTPETPTSAGGLLKLGEGVLSLSGRNAWRGKTFVAGGVLAVASPAALPGWEERGRVEVAEGAKLVCGAGWSRKDVARLKACVLGGGTVERTTELVTVPWMCPDVKPSGSWRADFDQGAPDLGTGRYAWHTSALGDSVTFDFTGTAVGFLYRTNAKYEVWGLIHRDAEEPGGFIEAFVDGQSAGLYDTSAGDRVLVAKGLTEGRHTLKLVNRGRNGRPARLALRGFLADEFQTPLVDWSKDDAALATEVAKLPPLVFFTGAPLESGAIPNAIWQSKPYRGQWGCSIRVRNPDGAVRTVFEEGDSLIYDLSLAFDAKKLLFTMKRHRARAWQIFEIGLDGRNLRPLTNTPEAHNASPCYLPSGQIAFVSSRTPYYHTVCQDGPCMHVHVMDGDGSNVKRLSSNTLSDFSVGVLSDGRLLYTRWSYVDWNLTYRQSLWTQYPDGRQMALWFGNQTVDPASLTQAMELPGKAYGAVCTFAPHHGSVYGAIGSVYTQKGPEGEGPDVLRLWTPEFPCIYDRNHFWAWCWPAPLADDRVVASRGDGATQRFKLMLLAADGRRATVYEDRKTSCFRPLPLKPRKAPKEIAPFVNPAPRTYTLPAAPPGQDHEEKVPLGYLLVSDVYKGLDGKVPRGTVTHVRVMEQLPKTVNRLWTGVLDQGPIMGASSYYGKRVWSTVPVATDGSVFFEAPALKEIYLQLIDAEGREIRRMTDAINLMPGETQSCTGCHEGRRTAAAPLATTAARRAPTPITPPAWGNAGILDYVKIVQPVWDRHCVKCHSGGNPPKGLSLSGGYTRFFNMSYDNLVLRSKSDAQSRDYFTGKSKVKPLVQGLHLLYGIAEPFEIGESGSLASRLPEYLTKAHHDVDMPAADRRRVYEWIDSQLVYYATSDHAHVGGKSGRDRWGEADGPELKPWLTKRFLPIYRAKCASCHGDIDLGRSLTNVIEPQWWWFDLSRPEWSPALTAHLAKEAGGRGCAKFTFASKDDPTWKELASIAREAAAEAAKTPEADMPGFVPRSRGRCEYWPGM